MAFAVLTVQAFAEPIQYATGTSAYQLGAEFLLCVCVGDDRCLSIYDGKYATTYHLPKGTLLY